MNSIFVALSAGIPIALSRRYRRKNSCVKFDSKTEVAMSSEASSSKNVIDNLQKQVYEFNEKLNVPSSSSNAVIIGTQEAPNSPTSHFAVSNLEERENACFAPVQHAFNFYLSRNEGLFSEEQLMDWQSQIPQFSTTRPSYDSESTTSSDAVIIGTQKAPNYPTSHFAVSNPEEREDARFAPVQHAAAFNFNLPRTRNESLFFEGQAMNWQSQIPQFLTSRRSYDPTILSSAENNQAISNPQTPETAPTNLTPQAEAWDTNGQPQQNSTQSQPVAPSGAIEYHPSFIYTPPVEMASSITTMPIFYQPVQSQPVPITMGLHQPPLHHQSNAAINSQKQRKKILSEAPDFFVANDPFDIQIDFNEEMEKLTFDDIDLSPIQGNPTQPRGQPPREPIVEPVPDISPVVHSQSFSSQTHFQNDPTNIGTDIYPYQLQSGEINEPFTPANMPVRSSFWTNLKDFLRWPFAQRTSQSRPEFDLPYYMCRPRMHTPNPLKQFTDIVVQLFLTTLPRQVYLHFLLRLPSFYFSRVARIFEEADLTLREIKRMTLETGLPENGPADLYAFESSKNVPLQYTKLKSTWDSFIDSVLREWKTLNLISVLLLSAILTMLQISGVAQNPVTRYTSLAALICSLMSLLFGCTYIIRFGTMRKAYKAAEWALEAQQTRTTVWWNVWVLLAMPAVWLTWSIILFTVCIMSFVWQSSSDTDQNPPNPISAKNLLIIRIAMSSVLGLGVVYGILILSTFRRYGRVMDQAWKGRIHKWVEQKTTGSRSNHISDPESESGPQNPMYYGGSQTNFPFYPAQATAFGVYKREIPHEASLPFSVSVNDNQSQFPDLTLDDPTLSESTPSQALCSEFGHFSGPKSSELATEEPQSYFVPPNEDFLPSPDPILVNDNQFQFPNVTLDVPTPSIPSQPLYSGAGYFSVPRDSFHSPNEAHLSNHDSGSQTQEMISSSTSNHDKTELQHGLELSSLPQASRASSSTSIIPFQRMEHLMDPDDDPDYTDHADSGGRPNERRGLRTVRFRSPLVSPEITQFEGSISGQNEETLESVLSVLPDGSLSMTTSSSTPGGPGPTHPEFSANVPQSTS